MPTYSVAIVGAGPAGYFAAQALQNLENEDLKFQIDMIERLPTPWGLVRSGVAPDHPKIKSVSKVFEKIATSEGFQLFCNVELGKDLTVKELKESYDAIIIATGSSIGRKLGIPGEDLIGSISASEFVPWYNGHPDFANLDITLESKEAVVIGAGNVAMDVARILALEPSELEPTDTALHAIENLYRSNIRTVHIFGRRGPEHAAFTSPELRELPKLEHTNVTITESDILQAQERLQSKEEVEKEIKSNLDAMLAISQAEKKNHQRELNFHFLATPLEIRGNTRVEEIIFRKNIVVNGDVLPTDETFTIKTGLVISAIGYQSEPLAEIPYENGRVLNKNGLVEENVFVVGWAKRGPSGVIGTNKSDAAEVVKLLVSSLKSPKDLINLESLLKKRSVKIVNQGFWQTINASEIAAGEEKGKPRIKFVNRDEMLSLQ
ncbi:MAG: FAD-dependent oxidoreductase [Actinobacteria bacterium]|nr:FAD-dependent oxidoreductase [Actinomycetota bacterium]